MFCRKLGDGLFLNCCRNVAKQYPEIELNDMIIDNASMQVSELRSVFYVVTEYIRVKWSE